jgi:hypothetical protein
VADSYGGEVLTVGVKALDRSSFASSEKKVYRFNSLYRWYHFAVGAVFLVTAVVKNTPLIFLIPILLFSAFMIARPLTSAVTVDQYSVTLKTMFSEHSLNRSSITSIERVNTGKGTSLILRGNTKEELVIGVNLFAFDQAWDDWLSTYKDLSSDKPLRLFEN